ncbi:MAG: response regulator, partial [Nitrospinales bacterium]
MCLDNDPSILKMTQTILQSEFVPQRLEFYEAESGEKGLEMVERLAPDIVLSDVEIPGMERFEVCRKIQGRQHRPAVILTSSGESGEDDAIQAYQSGADAFLSKPVKKGELLFIINFILRLSQLDETISKKNKQLEDSLGREQSCQTDLTSLNHELLGDKRRLDTHLQELVDLNRRLEAKNTQVSSVMEELRNQFDSTVALLTNIIELNRHENKGHADRVAETSVYIANKLGLSH